MKKVWSIILVTIMLLGMLQVSAMAELSPEESFAEEPQNNGEVEYDPEAVQRGIEDLQKEDAVQLGLTDNNAKFVVLIVDSTDETEGKVLDVQKQASISFCEEAFAENDPIYVTVVALTTNPYLACFFSNNINDIQHAIQDITTSGRRNVNDALVLADGLLNWARQNNPDMSSGDVVLFSEGAADIGKEDDNSHYQGEDAALYEQVFRTSKTLLDHDYQLFAVQVFDEATSGQNTEQWTIVLDEITRGEQYDDIEEYSQNPNRYELKILQEPFAEDEDIFFDPEGLAHFWSQTVFKREVPEEPSSAHEETTEQEPYEADQAVYDALIEQVVITNAQEEPSVTDGEGEWNAQEDEYKEPETTTPPAPIGQEEQTLEPESEDLSDIEPDYDPAETDPVETVPPENQQEDPIEATEAPLETEIPMAVEAVIGNEVGISLDGAQESALSNITGNGTVRFNVLILDTSGSMDGTPEEIQKQAAVKFCESVLNAPGENLVAIVSLNTNAYTVCDFTNDVSVLEVAINDMYAEGGTNINEALEVASSLMDSAIAVYPEGIRNIVLCSDGLPEHGATAFFGHYTLFDSFSYYAYANKAYSTAESIKAHGNTIYSLGFFHSLSGSELKFGRRVLLDISSGADYYFEVVNAGDLEFTFGEVAETITDQGAQEIEFHYSSGGNDYTAPCYYTDNYFRESAYDYNASLATMSLSFAMSAFGSDRTDDYRDKSMNAKDLLLDIGMSEQSIETNKWFTEKPTADSIGLVVGSKQIEDDGEPYTLIAMAVRGGGYGREWASNFTIGATGQHQGFDEAKNQAVDFLHEYISDQRINGKVKFWITGYSRAAATANLIGGALDQGIAFANVSYSNDDVFIYTFETPAGARIEDDLQNEKYNNIFNVINLNDPVPYVAPEHLGFGRYGIDHPLPEVYMDAQPYWTKLDAMLQQYESLPSQSRLDYVVDDFTMKKLDLTIDLFAEEKIKIIQDDLQNPYTQSIFLSRYVQLISQDFIRSRDNYVQSYEDDIREVCKLCFGFEDGPLEDFVNTFLKQAEEHWADLIVSFLPNTKSTDEVIREWLQAAVNENGLTGLDAGQLTQAAVDLSGLAIDLAASYPNYLISAVANASGLGGAHYPELCWAWLSSMDPNFNGQPASFSNGNYRIIHINCAVDVEVTDENGNIVAAIVNEERQNVGASILCGIDSDGQKIVILPINAEYSIDITGREDDDVNYGISEYSIGTGDVVRNINYFDIPVAAGETLEATVPSYSDYEIANDTRSASSASYTVLNADGIQIQPDADLTGEAASTYYDVFVSSNNNEMGIVSGSGMRLYGDYAMVDAFPAEGYEFVSWQENGTTVSNESEYRFCVTEDTTLVAVFQESDTTTPSPVPNPQAPTPTPTTAPVTVTPTTDVVTVTPQKTNSWTITFDPNGGETNIVSAATNKDGFLTSLPTPTKEGYVFTGWYDEDGKTISTSTMFTRDQTIQARWAEDDEGTYLVAAGADGTWVKGSRQDFTFTLVGDLDSFRSITVDGSNIRANAYSIDANNRNINIVSGYLEGLPVGEHEFVFTFKDGECSANLHVVNAAATPSPTADNVSIPVETTSSSNKSFTVVILIVLFLACAGGAVAAVMMWRTKKKREKQKYYTDRNDPWT